MDAPKFCPWCGKEGTLYGTSGSFHAEAGCWDGDSYCWDGELPGFVCDKEKGGCRATFLYEPELTHEDCSCASGRCDDGEDCEHYLAQEDEDTDG